MLDVINRYAHGFVAVPVILACKEKGLFAFLKREGFMSIEQIIERLGANGGHLQVALRMMQSLNWLERNDAGEYSLTQESEIHQQIPKDILELYRLPIESYLMEQQLGLLENWIERSKRRWNVDNPLIADFLDGILLIPILLALHKHKLLQEAQEEQLFHQLNPLVREELCNLFVSKGWAELSEDNLCLTDIGRFMVQRSLITGVTASYAPMFSRISEVLFGDCQAVFRRNASGYENHIDRTLNVLGSGFQHEKYFVHIEEVILSVFNQLPFEEQPKYVADMGCGDGTLLKRVYETIRLKSARGKVLKQYPLRMIGVDYNKAALIETTRTLADIPYLVLHGDVGNPEQMVRDLEGHGIYDRENILHIRSFLDHDRPFIPPQQLDRAQLHADLPYHGVYVSTEGKSIPPHIMVQSLVEHLKRWSFVVGKHGLIILEVHCVEPKVVHSFLDRSENLHFDAYQAFSMQHLVEADVFLMSAAEVGLFPKFEFSKRYPKTFPFTRITLNYFENRPYTIRHAYLSDLPALVNIEVQCWPEHLQTAASEICQRIEKFPNGNCVLEMDGQIVGVIYAQRIKSAKALKNVTYVDVPSLHTADGSVIQLLSLNILPQMQDKRLGDCLREFMLQLCALKGGIESVVGVTRCKNFQGALIPMEEYIHHRNQLGQLVDPILRFHEEGGAAIKGIIPNYRPEDADNQGIGILIEYDLHNRQRKHYKVTKETELRNTESLDSLVKECIRSVTGKERQAAVYLKQPLMEIGLDSLELLELRALLESRLEVELEPTFFFKYKTPEAIIRYFKGQKDSDSKVLSVFDTQDFSNGNEADSSFLIAQAEDAIAIVGMACRFPGGVYTPEEYWSILRNGIDAIGTVPKTCWDIERYYDPQPKQAGKISSKYGGFLDRVDQFDAQFFRIAPREATSIDPQQRILLEETWTALENAGINPESLAGTQTGVFVGIFSHDYELLEVKHNQDKDFDTYYATGSSASLAAGRLSYFFGFTGPAISVNTACSSSLVAVHLACQSLLNGECELALASGVNLILSPELSIAFSQAGMLSPDGRCKTFDASANGYVRSEGCGVVVLKSLKKALADNDNIQGVVRGTAINQDGASNGLTAPNASSQEAVIRRSLSVASVNPNEISYVEVHGTGTSLGDPIEVEALEAVYGQRRLDNPLVIGSVKTNIGHLEAAAGIAGLLKTVLSMQNQYIPPHLHFKKLNPYINPSKIPIVIPTEGMKWRQSAFSKRRLAGVSSFGFSGTNAHVILEEAQAPRRVRGSERHCYLLTLSAKSQKALQELARSYADFLASHPKVFLPDVCFTANTGRAHFDYRLAVVAESSTELCSHLESFVTSSEAIGLTSGQVTNKIPQIAFLFTGQGSQYVGMAQQLYQTQPTFRQTLKHCDEILRPYLEKPLLEILYPQETENQESSKLENVSALINQTTYTQVALFAIEYSLAQLWQSWGIKPDVVMGHSVGEYVAACIAGVFSLEDGLKLVAARGSLMQALPLGGEMVAVLASENEVQQAIAPYTGEVAIAALNAPKSTVISGQGIAIANICQNLEAKGIKTKRLQVSHAFHSPLMEPMLAAFEAVAQQINYSLPQIKLVSNVTGLVSESEIATPQYWVRHVRQPVQFARGIQSLHQEGCEIFMEIGPKPILLGMGRQCLPPDTGMWLSSLSPGTGDTQQLSKSLAQLYVRGVVVDWSRFEGDGVRKVVLPTYPFERQRYWIETPHRQAQQVKFLATANSSTSIINLIEKGDTQELAQQLEKVGKFSYEQLQLLPELLSVLVKQHQQELTIATAKDWLYQVEWQPKPRQLVTATKEKQNPKPDNWLIFADSNGVGQALATYLQQQGHCCNLVYLGDCYQRLGNSVWSLNPAQLENFERLFQEVVTTNQFPLKGVIHLWSLEASSSEELTISDLEQAQRWGCGSVLFVVQALLKYSGSPLPRLWLVTRGTQAVKSDANPLAVAQAPLWGIGRTVALEHPQLWGGMVDLAPEVAENEIEALFREIEDNLGEDHLAFREGQRYVARLVKQPLLELNRRSLRSNATYLITGGLGALGLLVAQWMVEQGARHMVLMGRRANSEAAEEVLSQLKKVGAQVQIMPGDVSNQQDLMRILQQIDSSLPPLSGIIHVAGILDDGVLQQISWERLMRVMTPKVLGSWNLHSLTQNRSLDFFICFSSITSLLGSLGQGNYAAANAFMDALAYHRRAMGLPGLSINWGPWETAGMAANLNHHHQARFAARGVSFIHPKQGLQVLEMLLKSSQAQVGVLSVDWSMYEQQLSQTHQLSLLSELISNTEYQVKVKSKAQNISSFLEKLKASTESESPAKTLCEHQNILITHIQLEVAKVLGLNSSQLPNLEQGFAQMGMDSVMAVELSNRLQVDLEISLPATLVMEYPTINKLSKYLSEEVMKWGFVEKADSKVPKLEEQETDALSELEKLSEEEFAASVAQELAEIQNLLEGKGK